MVKTSRIILLVCSASLSASTALAFRVDRLTPEQRAAELEFFINAFDEYYAPMEYKEKKWNQSWAEHVREYRLLAARDQTESEFDDLITRFVAWARDGHTHASRHYNVLDGVTRSDIEATTLGFETQFVPSERKYVITRLFPKLIAPSTGPLPQVGDRILSIDGQAVSEYIRARIAPYFTSGHEPSDRLTQGHMISIRPASVFDPLSGSVKLKIARGGTPETEMELTVPWTIVDQGNRDGLEARAGRALTEGGAAHSPFQLEYRQIISRLAGGTGVSAAGIPLKDPDPSVSSDLFKSVRAADGSLTAYFRIEDFASSRLHRQLNCALVQTPEGGLTVACGPGILKAQAQAMYQSMEKTGVKNIVLDLRGNPGGLVQLGLQLVRIFAKEAIPAPKFSVRLSQEWITSFHSQSLYAGTPEEKAKAKSIHEALLSDLNAGQRLSRPIPVTGVDVLEPAADKPFSGGLILLIDEECLSMCDIFSMLFQGHPGTTLIGSQTMGAGGNVLSAGKSPYRKISLTQTNSLVVNPRDGGYLENNGVKPDVPYSRTLADVTQDDADFRAFLTSYIDKKNAEDSKKKQP